MNMSAESILQSYLAVAQMGETLHLMSSLTHDTIAWKNERDIFAYIYVYKNTGIKELQEIIKASNNVPLFVITEESISVDSDNILCLSLEQLKSIVFKLQHYSHDQIKILLKAIFGKAEYDSVYDLLLLMENLNLTAPNEGQKDVIAKQETVQITSDVTAKSKKESPNIPIEVQRATISAIESKLGIKLKKGKNQYYYGEGDTCVLLAFSRTYKHKKNDDFWYGFHKKHKEELEKHKNSFVVYGCYQENFAFILPLQIMCELLKYFKTTINDKAYYWHIKIFRENNKSFFKISDGKHYSLDSYSLECVSNTQAQNGNSFEPFRRESNSKKIVLSQGLHEVKIKK